MRSRPARDGHVAGVRAAEAHRHAEALAWCRPRRRRPTPPAGSSRVRASRSAATVTSAPRSWAAATTRRRSRTAPSAPGYCTSTPKTSPSGEAASAMPSAATTTSMPSGSARVCMTAMRLRQDVGVDDEDRVGRRLAGAAHQGHRLGGRGALVEQRGAGDRQAGQVADHGLEVEQRLEPALGDLRLVRRVGGVPGGVLQHVAPDHRRGDRAVVAEADHRGQHLVARRPARAARRATVVLGRGRGQIAAVARRGCSPGTAAATSVVERARSRRPRASARRRPRRGPMWRAAKVRRARVATGSCVTRAPDGCDCASPSVAGALQSAWSARSWRLRGSGEVAPSALRRRPYAAWRDRAETLPRGIVSAPL